MPRRPDPEQDVKKKPFLPEIKAKPLTPEMRRRVTKEKVQELRVKAELDLEDQLTKEAEDAVFEEEKQKALQSKEPTETLRPIFIDLPPEAPYLLTNGQICYYPEQEYLVTKAVYDDLNSRMWMAWVNEANRLDDHTANQYKRSRNVRISKKGTTYG
jgi:hypothetical protein